MKEYWIRIEDKYNAMWQELNVTTLEKAKEMAEEVFELVKTPDNGLVTVHLFDAGPKSGKTLYALHACVRAASYEEQ